MKLFRLLMVLALVMALLVSTAAVPTEQETHEEEEQEQDHEDLDYDITEQSLDEATEINSEHGFGRFLSQKKLKTPRRMRCNKFPRICHAKGSPGPHCCKKKCVDVLIDRLNCGACGKKCKYNQICCNGKCVNPSFNRRHCGGCNNRCNNGKFCAFGLCNYA